jgi:hypothetical protein
VLEHRVVNDTEAALFATDEQVFSPTPLALTQSESAR